MTEYGNYQQKEVQHNTEQGHQTTPVKTGVKSEWQSREFEQLHPSNDSISEKTQEILSAASSTTTLLEEHDFESKLSDKNGLFEKTKLVGQPILSESHKHSKLDEKQPDTQMQIRKKDVEESLKPDNFAAKINTMTVDELEEALANPAITNKESQLIFEKLDLLAAELTDVIQNTPSLSESNKLDKDLDENKTNLILHKDDETEAEQVELSKAIEKKELGASLGKNAVSISAFGEFSSLRFDPNSKEPKASFDPQTGILKGPKELLKLYQPGQKIKYKDENGKVIECEIKRTEKFTKEEREAFQQYISANYPTTNSHVSVHEEAKDKDKENKPTNSKETKQRGEVNRADVNETQQKAKLNGFKLESASAGLINGKSSQVVFMERLQKLEEKFKRLEEQIEQEIQKHEGLVQETLRNELNLETKKDDFRLDGLTAENLEVENQYKDLLKMVNEPKKGFELPLTVSKKIKAIDTSFQKMEKLVHKADAGNINTDDMLEISSLKKEVIGIAVEMLNTSGTHVTKGTHSEGKTAPAA